MLTEIHWGEVERHFWYAIVLALLVVAVLWRLTRKEEK